MLLLLLLLLLLYTSKTAIGKEHTHTQPFYGAVLDFVRDYPGEPGPER